jgi:hypothetical protein
MAMQRELFQQGQRQQVQGTAQNWALFKQYAGQEADLISANLRRTAMTSPVYAAAEERVLGDLSDEARGERISSKLGERLRQAQAARGMFGSPSGAAIETMERVQFEEGLRQQSLGNAMGFAQLQPFGSVGVGGFAGALQAARTPDPGGLMGLGVGTGMDAFGFKAQQRVASHLQHAYFAEKHFGGWGQLIANAYGGGGGFNFGNILAGGAGGGG